MAEVQKKENKKEKPSLKYQRDKDREPVRGIFKFYEVPGGVLSFVFKKYKEDQVEKFTLVDGQIYTLPLGVAKHLNNNCWYPVHEYQRDDAGKPVATIGRKVARTGFQSLEFVDVDDLNPSNTSTIVEAKPI